MDLHLLECRQAVGAWRDHHSLAAASLINGASLAALDDLDKQLGKADLVSLLWDPARFAAPLADRLMRLHCEEKLAAAIDLAAVDLSALSSDYAALATALSRSAPDILYPVAREPSDAELQSPPETASAQANLLPVKPGEASPETPSWLTGRIGEMSTWAFDRAGRAAETAGYTIKDYSGLHGRLRDAFRVRISQAWMASSGSPRPVLSQVLLMFDEVTGQVRSRI